MAWLLMALIWVQHFFRDRGDLALENLALRRQRPGIRQVDRIVEAMKWLRAER